MSVVGEEKALAPKGKAGGEMLKRGGDWQSVEDLAIIIGVGCFRWEVRHSADKLTRTSLEEQRTINDLRKREQGQPVKKQNC